MKQVVGIILVAYCFILQANNGNSEIAENNVTTINIETQVTDKKTGEALTGVAVYVDNELWGYTDFDGKLLLKNLSVGLHEVTTSMISYKKVQKEVKVETKSDTFQLQLENL